MIIGYKSGTTDDDKRRTTLRTLELRRRSGGRNARLVSIFDRARCMGFKSSASWTHPLLMGLRQEQRAARARHLRCGGPTPTPRSGPALPACPCWPGRSPSHGLVLLVGAGSAAAKGGLPGSGELQRNSASQRCIQPYCAWRSIDARHQRSYPTLPATKEILDRYATLTRQVGPAQLTG
jgi:hypothetical protein